MPSSDHGRSTTTNTTAPHSSATGTSAVPLPAARENITLALTVIVAISPLVVA